jgi:hypothetical protein
MRPCFCDEWGNPSSAYKFGSTRMAQLNSEDAKTRRLENKGQQDGRQQQPPGLTEHLSRVTKFVTLLPDKRRTG